MEHQITIGRLAMRMEGEFWNAYWAPQQTSLTGAILLGSIRMSIIENNSDFKDVFKRLMEASVELAIKESTGKTAS